VSIHKHAAAGALGTCALSAQPLKCAANSDIEAYSLRSATKHPGPHSGAVCCNGLAYICTCAGDSGHVAPHVPGQNACSVERRACTCTGIRWVLVALGSDGCFCCADMWRLQRPALCGSILFGSDGCLCCTDVWRLQRPALCGSIWRASKPFNGSAQNNSMAALRCLHARLANGIIFGFDGGAPACGESPLEIQHRIRQTRDATQRRPPFLMHLFVYLTWVGNKVEKSVVPEEGCGGGSS